MVEEGQSTGSLVDSSACDIQSSSRIKVSFGVKRTNEVKIQDVPSTVMNADIDSDEERAHEEAKNRAKRRKIKNLHELETFLTDEGRAKLAILTEGQIIERMLFEVTHDRRQLILVNFVPYHDI
uniref:Uncharacterized protein n=1 Tax=Heterorhabditis bacteriophora TaxID=37862 RepID=A0A1I7X7Q4_HETBA